MGLVHRRSARGTVRPARPAGVRGRPQSRRARRVDRPASMSSDRWRKTRPEEQRAITLHAANLRAAAVGTRGLVRSFAVAALRKMLVNPFDRVSLSYDDTWRQLAEALNLQINIDVLARRVQRRRGAECRLDARVCGWIVCASALPTLCERGLAPGTAQADRESEQGGWPRAIASVRLSTSKREI